MAPRPRSKANKGLPDHLYCDDGYYSWRDPRDGKKYGLGRDRASAIKQANEANFAIKGELAKARLIDRITGDCERTFANFRSIYLKALEKRKLSANVLKDKERNLNVCCERFGDYIMARITTLDIVPIIDEFIAKEQGRTAQVYRALLLDYFREAQAKGWIDRNPVEVIKQPVADVKRSRLVLSDFRAIYSEALKLEPWVSNSIALAIVTGQRREDIAAAKFSDVKDGFLWISQGKTGTKIKIPLSIKLNAVQWTLEEIIRRCRDSALSHYLIHNTKKHVTAKIGDKLHPSSLSAGFAKARDMAVINHGLTWEGAPPSFHEIRSLSERLYKEQGVDTQTLLGHKNAKMTAVYHDSRGAEWLEVKV